MPRPQKDSSILNMRIDRKIAERLESFCIETSRTKTAAVEMILREYFDRLDKENNQQKSR